MQLWKIFNFRRLLKWNVSLSFLYRKSNEKTSCCSCRKRLGNLKTSEPLLKESKQNLTSRTRSSVIQKLMRKKPKTEYLLICMASEESANDKYLARATFLEPLAELTMKEWLWWMGTEKSSNYYYPPSLKTDGKIFIWYLIQSLVSLTSFPDSPPSAYRRNSCSQVVYMIMLMWLFTWLTSFRHLFSVLIQKDLRII